MGHVHCVCFLMCFIYVMDAGEGGRVGGRVQGWGGIDHGKNETAKGHPQEDYAVNAYIQTFSEKKGSSMLPWPYFAAGALPAHLRHHVPSCFPHVVDTLQL